MHSNKTFLFLLILPLMVACGASMKNDGLTIEGKITDAANLKLYFDKYNISTRSSTILGTSEIDGKGNFKLHFEKELPGGIYRIRIGAQKTLFILDGNESEITINGTLDELKSVQYSVTGSKVMQEFIDLMASFRESRPTGQDIADAIKSTDNIFLKTLLAQQILKGNPTYMDLYEDIEKKVKGNENLSPEFQESYAIFMANARRQQLQQQRLAKVQVGKPAPEISLPNPQGKIISLSDYQGKLVLLDFWASWCRPCRRNNPHLVEMYKKYKDQGFTIFSVSLDGIGSRLKKRLGGDETRAQYYRERGKKMWIAAIEKDNLSWEAHVSDLKKWDSVAAQKYGVSSIPKMFLIGRDGKILAINPRYNLEETIKKFL